MACTVVMEVHQTQARPVVLLGLSRALKCGHLATTSAPLTYIKGLQSSLVALLVLFELERAVDVPHDGIHYGISEKCLQSAHPREPHNSPPSLLPAARLTLCQPHNNSLPAQKSM
ncbi:hypothetical protein WMY93_003020 [Mugilogobius chulae]|uniref:Uncharacterized protein n=1 Tax=Mugilogobius chulae TaxID=88201 RepID=A0AAW0PYB7_9GOBI